MSLPLLIALFVAQGQVSGPASALPPQQAFSSPFSVAEPNRIALTPKIDGKLDDEEWDPLSKSPDMQSFFEWEPGKFHIAAIVPTGHDVIASFDLHADGWLHGKDNLEVRLSNSQGKVSVVARLLDGTDINGPKWIDIPGFSLSSYGMASSDGTTVTYEATIGDCGLNLIPTAKGTKIMVRMDDPLSTDPPSPSYLPRMLSPVTLVMARCEALPTGLKFNPEMVGRSVVAGESTRLRLAFDGANTMKLQKLEMHTEGPYRGDANQLSTPFPVFDSRGRSYVDYSTGITEGSPQGYRILKGTLTTSDNISAILECNFRVGPVVDFELVQNNIPIAPLDRSMKFTFYVRSNSTKGVSGDVTIVVPDPLRVVNGSVKNIGITTSRGVLRESFEMFLPPNVSGTFPIKFMATLRGKKVEQVQFLTIGTP